MRGSRQSFRTYLTAMAALSALGLAAQSCGVMSSSTDCGQRATCSEGGTGIPGGGDGSGGQVAEASDDGSGQSEADDTGSEGAATGDDVATGQDVASDGVTVIPDANEHEGGKDEDVADVVTEKSPADGCVPTSATENCSNGIDDNCDGKIDCAEAACQTAGYTCVPVAPAGWTGPALLWTGAFGTAAPGCPMGYHSLDAKIGPTGTADSCSCKCAALGQQCSANGTFHADQMCSYVPCASVSLSSASGTGACTTITSNTCGTGGSFSGPTTLPVPSGGSCTPQVTPTPGTPASWTTSARVCSWTAPPDIPGGCTAGGEQCIGSSGSFGSMACVYQNGDASCPNGYPNKTLLYTGETDTRGCGSCTCSNPPSGGTCAGSISFWGDVNAGCGGAATVTSSLGGPCKGYMGVGNNPGYVQANYTLTPGTCSVPAQPTATGAVTGTGPTTVCCK
jgi:hypothetical protein